LLGNQASAAGDDVKFDRQSDSTYIADLTSGDGVLNKLSAAEQALNKTKDPAAKEAQTKGIATGVGAGVGALALGLGAGFMTQSIVDKNHELEKLKKSDEAVKKWFDNVGSKIQCSVGGKVLGSYGETIELK